MSTSRRRHGAQTVCILAQGSRHGVEEYVMCARKSRTWVSGESRTATQVLTSLKCRALHQPTKGRSSGRTWPGSRRAPGCSSH